MADNTDPVADMMRKITLPMPLTGSTAFAVELAAKDTQIATLTARVEELGAAEQTARDWIKLARLWRAERDAARKECAAIREALGLAEDWIAKSPGDGDCTVTILGTLRKALAAIDGQGMRDGE